MQPRNTFVTVVEIKEAEKTTEAGIVLPSQTGQQYKLCKVVAVGPGCATMKDERSTTADLKSGQTVLVKLKQKMRVSADAYGLEPIGVGFTDDAGRPCTLVDESQIVGVVAEPGEAPALTLA